MGCFKKANFPLNFQSITSAHFRSWTNDGHIKRTQSWISSIDFRRLHKSRMTCRWNEASQIKGGGKYVDRVTLLHTFQGLCAEWIACCYQKLKKPSSDAGYAVQPILYSSVYFSLRVELQWLWFVTRRHKLAEEWDKRACEDWREKLDWRVERPRCCCRTPKLLQPYFQDREVTPSTALEYGVGVSQGS